MQFSPDKAKSMSNQALFTLIDNKKQAIERLKKEQKNSKKEEVEYCYLVRERQKRFCKRDKHPACCLS